MKGLFSIAAGLALAATTFAATISTGTPGGAAWTVYNPATGTFVHHQMLPRRTGLGQGTGSLSVGSYGAIEGTSCVVGQTPGNGCAHTFDQPQRDIWTYQLVISAATCRDLGNVEPSSSGSDNRVSMFVATTRRILIWRLWANGNGFNPLCNGTATYAPANLNGDGSLTITAYDYNDPMVPACPGCGNPSGFIVSAPSPLAPRTRGTATFGLVALAGVAGLAPAPQTSI